eukprot:scaffold2791_cov154-Amphora_coffeaeformis.AAC.9
MWKLQVLLAVSLCLQSNSIRSKNVVVFAQEAREEEQESFVPATPPHPDLVSSSSSNPPIVEANKNYASTNNNIASEEPPSKVPTHKLSAIFPAASVPVDMKESWQQHLVEQMASSFPTVDERDNDDSSSRDAAADAVPSLDKNNDAPVQPRDEEVDEQDQEDKVQITLTKLSSSGRDYSSRFQGDFGAFGDDNDERTLLDVFGEAAKEFLTQRVIPDTDEQCRWDWRSVRCEPACECRIEGQLGDYHLGRACRLRDEVDESCVPVDPASIWQDTPVTRRILSLVTQSADIIKLNIARGWDKTMSKVSQRFAKMQHLQCDELWALYHEQAQSRTCLPLPRIPSRSVPQRILCGPVDFDVCDDTTTTTAAATTTTGTPQDTMTRPAFAERI